jgi:hypothetical protein
LLSFGPAGGERLAQHFVTTQDRYSREQIAEELQRHGRLAVRPCEDSGRGRTQVTERLILGKSTFSPPELESGLGPR